MVLTRDAEPIADPIPDAGTITIGGTAAGAAMAAPRRRRARPYGSAMAQWTPGGQVTVPLEVLGVSNLRSATVTVTYDPNKLIPTACTPNRQDFVERPYGLHLDTDARGEALHIVHMRAWLDAGTDVSYEWDFGDGEKRIDTGEVSHVYNSTAEHHLHRQGDRHQRLLPVGLGARPTVAVSTTADRDPGPLDTTQPTGCREETPGQLTFELISRNKHGLSGNLLLADLTFAAKTGATGQAALEVSPSSIQLMGPGYETLQYKINAGGPVYAPTPMRALLDVQPCPQTQAADVRALPFWKDYKEMLWARAAGDMEILYFYPLQEGFYLTDEHAIALGLVDPKTRTPSLSPEKRVGKCVPWMDKLAQGTTTVDYED